MKIKLLRPRAHNEYIDCIFCNESADNIVIEEDGYKGRKCPTCGLIYISPRPSLTKIKELYSLNKHARESGITHFFGTRSKKLIAKHHLKIIKKYIKIGSLLEIGPGSGDFLDEARKEGYDVYGIELNKILSEFIRQKLCIPCEDSSLNTSFFEGKRFDVIYHRDVLSHFYDPISEFKKMYHKLKNRGFIIFETGNLGDVEKKYYKYYPSFKYPDHLFFFSTKNIKELLSRTGFELISIYRFSITPHLILAKIIRILMSYQFENTFKYKKSDSYVRLHTNIKTTVKDVFSCLIEFVIKYKLGYVLPKKGRPQTLIVIATRA